MKERGIKTIGITVIAIVVTAVVVGAGTWALTGREEKKANALELYHWWTSGSEQAAINNLIDVYSDEYPDVKIINSPVSGGAGASMKALMKSLVLGGEAPDAFQIHAGYEMKPYVDADLLDPITDLWEEEEWSGKFPDVVKSMVKFEGEYYAVPVNIHRVNVVFYNKHVFDEYGLSEPTTWSEFWNVCDTLEAEGVTPIALGDKNSWTSAHAFEQILASEGIDFYQEFVNGEVTSASNTNLVGALDKFDKYLDYINEDWATLTWDQAASKVVTGDAAMTVMGDWANGTFKVSEKEYGTDYGAFPVPGTGNMFGLCIDAFEHPKGTSHPKNSLNWLKVVGSIEGQNAFNPIKGSIAARTDAPTGPYGPYQKDTMDDFGTVDYMYPSIVHGSGAPEAFAGDFGTIMSEFVTDRDVSSTAESIVNTVNQSKDDYTKEWDLR